MAKGRHCRPAAAQECAAKKSVKWLEEWLESAAHPTWWLQQYTRKMHRAVRSVVGVSRAQAFQHRGGAGCFEFKIFCFRLRNQPAMSNETMCRTELAVYAKALTSPCIEISEGGLR
jgi:hypothetical protein